MTYRDLQKRHDQPFKPFRIRMKAHTSYDVADLGIRASNWQQTGRTFSQGNFDYSPDGLVDVADLGILASQWQQELAAPSAPLPGAARKPAAIQRVATQVL
jgi:hypothetical protein